MPEPTRSSLPRQLMPWVTLIVMFGGGVSGYAVMNKTVEDNKAASAENRENIEMARLQSQESTEAVKEDIAEINTDVAVMKIQMETVDTRTEKMDDKLTELLRQMARINGGP